MPFPNFHSARMKQPSKYKKFAYKNIAPGIDIVLGITDDESFKEQSIVTALSDNAISIEGHDGSEVQAYRFDKSKFTTQQAKEWLKKHKKHYLSFHAAKETDSKPKFTYDKARLVVEVPDKKEYTPEGYLIVPAKLSKPGIFDYYGYELSGIPNLDSLKLYKIYQDASVLFDQETIVSFENKPLVDEHKEVNSDTWTSRAVGFVRDVHRSEDGYLACTLVITDALAIQDVEEGKKELSLGYDALYVPREDIEDKPIPLDANFVRVKIKGNHVAIVEEGRAGHDCRIQDTKEKGMEQVMLALQQITAMLKDLIEMEKAEQEGKEEQDSKEKLNVLQKEHDDLKSKHEALVKENDSFKSQPAPKPAAEEVEAAAEDRAAVTTDAKALMPTIDCKGKSNKKIMVEVLQSVHQDAAPLIDGILAGADLTQDAVDETKVKAAFAAVVSLAKENGLGVALTTDAKPGSETVDYDKMFAKQNIHNKQK